MGFEDGFVLVFTFLHSLSLSPHPSIKSSWNISVVKFLLEKLKHELVSNHHNYTDKELKGKMRVNKNTSLVSCLDFVVRAYLEHFYLLSNPYTLCW